MINKGAEEEFPVTWENCNNTGLLKTNGNGTGIIAAKARHTTCGKERNGVKSWVKMIFREYICKFEAMWSFETYLRNIQVSCLHHDMHLFKF